MCVHVVCLRMATPCFQAVTAVRATLHVMQLQKRATCQWYCGQVRAKRKEALLEMADEDTGRGPLAHGCCASVALPLEGAASASARGRPQGRRPPPPERAPLQLGGPVRSLLPQGHRAAPVPALPARTQGRARKPSTAARRARRSPARSGSGTSVRRPRVGSRNPRPVTGSLCIPIPPEHDMPPQLNPS